MLLLDRQRAPAVIVPIFFLLFFLCVWVCWAVCLTSFFKKPIIAISSKRSNLLLRHRISPFRIYIYTAVDLCCFSYLESHYTSVVIVYLVQMQESEWNRFQSHMCIEIVSFVPWTFEMDTYQFDRLQFIVGLVGFRKRISQMSKWENSFCFWLHNFQDYLSIGFYDFFFFGNPYGLNLQSTSSRDQNLWHQNDAILFSFFFGNFDPVFIAMNHKSIIKSLFRIFSISTGQTFIYECMLYRRNWMNAPVKCE